jgi:hypothetical protein
MEVGVGLAAGSQPEIENHWAATGTVGLWPGRAVGVVAAARQFVDGYATTWQTAAGDAPNAESPWSTVVRQNATLGLAVVPVHFGVGGGWTVRLGGFGGYSGIRRESTRCGDLCRSPELELHGGIDAGFLATVDPGGPVAFRLQAEELRWDEHVGPDRWRAHADLLSVLVVLRPD